MRYKPGDFVTYPRTPIIWEILKIDGDWCTCKLHRWYSKRSKKFDVFQIGQIEEFNYTGDLDSTVLAESFKVTKILECYSK